LINNSMQTSRKNNLLDLRNNKDEKLSYFGDSENSPSPPIIDRQTIIEKKNTLHQPAVKQISHKSISNHNE
jgi:hypothetical protein